MLEIWQYNDPARVAETLQRRDWRETYGCSACRYRGERVFGHYTCGVGNKPGPRGFCRAWSMRPSPNAPHV